ncbi:MAG: hypothetical protein KME22_01580 [Hassallia sp. WJT32-NPBG1]|nr:hypothetical protein [Hassallia sp. WJT32-NPBG1]
MVIFFFHMFIRLTSQQYALLLVKAVAIRKTLHPIAMTRYAIALKDMSDRVYRQKSPSGWKPGAIQTKPAYAGFKFAAHAGGLCSYSRTVHGVGFYNITTRVIVAFALFRHSR